MTHEDLQDAVPLYAAGALDRAERQALEAHLLSGCQSCHHALKEFQSVASLLPFGLSPMKPPRALKAKIMAARHPDSVTADTGAKEAARPSLEPGEWLNHLFPPVAPARSFSLPWAIGFATVLIVAGAGYFAWDYTTRLADDAAKIQQLETALQEQSTKMAKLQRDISQRDHILADMQTDIQRKTNNVVELQSQLMEREVELQATRAQLASGKRGKLPQDELALLLRRPNVRVVSMAGSEVAKTASAFLLYDAASKKIWLYAVNLPECLNNTVYQLWAIDQKSKSVGTFHMESGETTHLLVSYVSDFERAKKFAVTLEPPGGRPQPTGPIYLLGQTL